jgi:hypothetical protein
MAEADTQRALRYRNSAQHIRIEAQSIENGTSAKPFSGLPLTSKRWLTRSSGLPNTETSGPV